MKLYDRLERKYIKGTLDDLNKKGYRCAFSIRQLQDLVLFLSRFFNNTKIKEIEELGDYNFYFNYIKSEMNDFFIFFLLGYYVAQKKVFIFNKDTEYEKKEELAYYPIIKINDDADDISEADISYIVFDEKNGMLKGVPEGIDVNNITNIEELCIQNENSNIYDFSLIRSQIFIHKCDLIIRDIIIECTCINLMSKREVDLEERVKRTKIFIKSMVANLPNFNKANYLYSMVDTMYEENKKETSSGVFVLKKLN